MSSELAFFSLLVQQGSLARAARELGLTAPEPAGGFTST